MHVFGERPDFLGTHAHISRKDVEGPGHRWWRPYCSLRVVVEIAVTFAMYLGFLVPGVVMTPIGALSRPVAMAACIRAQNFASISE
jgi:hypothetical protein